MYIYSTFTGINVWICSPLALVYEHAVSKDQYVHMLVTQLSVTLVVCELCY